MNFKGVLNRLTTPLAVREEQEAASLKQQIEEQQKQQELLTQHNDWLNHPFSKLFIKELTDSQKFFNDNAERLALEQSNETNIPLIQSSTIKKVINYVTRRTSITGASSSNGSNSDSGNSNIPSFDNATGQVRFFGSIN